MKTVRFATALLLTLLLASFIRAGGDESAGSEYETFGPYIALQRNADIVKDVKVNENGRIYLLLDPAHKEEEIVLKNSSAYKDGYRKWFNGEYELVSPANQGKAPNDYTDWVETTANYVEYHMNGALILHLAKAAVHQ